MGGTFDPPHLGHLAAATAARTKLFLDSVVFVPANEPWQKTSQSPAADRLAMTRLAVQGHDGFEVSDVDLTRGGPTYTVDTLTDLHAEYGPHAQLYLLLGADAVANLMSWHRALELPLLAKLIALSRPGHALEIPTEFADTIEVVSFEALDISSTMCRELLQSGRSADQWVRENVLTYAADAGLYSTVRG